MRLHLLSDLHLTHAPFTPPATDADIVVLAGDIASGPDGIAWAAQAFPDKPVVLVPGNHEYYGWEVGACRADMRRAATSSPNVQLLDGDGATFSRPGETPVRVLGATLWTDFAVYGQSRVSQYARQVESVLWDYRAISLGDRLLRWHDTLAWHQRELAWLKLECAAARARGEKVVVVTHHGPSLKSSSEQYRNDPVTAGFLSNLEAFCAEGVDLWAHGHVHNTADYELGRCRVVTNPRGYPFNRRDPNTAFENRAFNPALVLEV
jgi:3',5'-cyclic AMP phosphodiesterase CpdA